MRKLIFALIAVVALLFFLEIGVTLLSQKGMERALRSQYDLPDSLEVSINSFPFIVSLARNHLGELTLDWEGELECTAEEGTAPLVPYQARVDLYDVELNMPSLLTGRLELREISRVKAFIFLDVKSLNEVFSLQDIELAVEGDELYGTTGGGEKAIYKVKVTDADTVTLTAEPASTSGEGFEKNPHVEVKTMRILSLPMGARLQTASVDRGRLRLAISIPSWEGYLGFLDYLFNEETLGKC